MKGRQDKSAFFLTAAGQKNRHNPSKYAAFCIAACSIGRKTVPNSKNNEKIFIILDYRLHLVYNKE